MANKAASRWARISADGETLVEFTFEDPAGRFHPDIKWIPVDLDVLPYSRVTASGVIEPPIPSEEIVGTPVDPDEELEKASLTGDIDAVVATAEEDTEANAAAAAEFTAVIEN